MEQTLHIAPPPRRLIINADDLGICAERDAGILELFACGAITSASLLVNGESAADAARRAVALRLPLGLHLNLSEGRLARPCTLTDADAHLLGKFGIRKALAANSVSADDLAYEIRAQLNAFIALTGELPSHVDGHHHIHVEPTVAAVLAPIMAREYGIYCVRLPRQKGLDAMAGDAAFNIEFDAGFLAGVARAAETATSVFSAHGIYSTDAFIGLSFMGQRLQPSAIAAALQALDSILAPASGQPLWVELMVHPGIPATDATRDAFCRDPARAHEMATLQSEAWRDAITGWEAGSFRELPRPDNGAGRPSLLIYGKLTPATGNAETARRYAAAWSAQADIRFRPVPEDIATTTALAREAQRLQEFAARERLDFAFGIHLYRAGTALAAAFASPGSPSLPFGLLASGTDANADIEEPMRAAAMAGALHAADFLLCLNSTQIHRLQALGLPAETSVLGNGIAVDTASTFSLRKALGLADDTLLVLFPAGLRRLKGVLPTIEALAPLLATRYTGHALVVLGPVIEADYAKQLAECIDTLIEMHPNLSGRIHLHDGLPHADYLAALREAGLVLNASEHEGLSHGLAEAMAAGIPVLARNIPGNCLLLRDGENGRLFPDFAALPAAYTACFVDIAATCRMAEQARLDIARDFPADAEQQALRSALERTLRRRQTTLVLGSGHGQANTLRLDLAPGTHPASAENIALFRQLALSPMAIRHLPANLAQAIDVGCGCGIFGFLLLDALARQQRHVGSMIFSDPHHASLQALARTLTRHAAQLPMLDTARLSTGSLLAPLLERHEKAALVCANLPQTPGPAALGTCHLDRWGGSDGAELICALIAQLPASLAPHGEAFMLHISLANPARVADTLATHGLEATVLAEQQRHARLAEYEAMLPGLATYLLAEKAAGRAEFTQHGDSIGFHARLLRISRSACCAC